MRGLIWTGIFLLLVFSDFVSTQIILQDQVIQADNNRDAEILHQHEFHDQRDGDGRKGTKGKPVETSEEPVVCTPSGKLRGRLLSSWTNKTIFSFRGIPYAEPPVGNLRFMAPVPIKRWDEIKNATKDGFICPQHNSKSIGISSEDCLNLNVYTNKLEGNRPVIVFFHPGAFYSMTGASYWYGPEYLLDQDIILVTVNYRLEALGFLSTEDRSAVGNYGLKDQVAALRWVNRHISSFGGNAANVTIAGYSAGSASVFFHMLSPMSKGLFHRAIAMSGGITSDWVLTKKPLDSTKKLASLFNCSTVSSSSMVECLRKIPADEIADQFHEIRTFGSDPMVVFGPVVESDSQDPEEERFLIGKPVELIQSKQFYKVPVVTGVTKEEFLNWGFDLVENQTLMKDLNENFKTIAPEVFGYSHRSKPVAEQISEAMWNWYNLGNGTLSNSSNSSAEVLGKLYSDAIINYGEYSTAKLLAKYSDAPVYFYAFNYLGNFGHTIDPRTNELTGPTHHDELIYLFFVSEAFPKFNQTDPEAKMVKTLTSFWANFATNGNPTPNDSPVQWEPMTENNLRYLDINATLTMRNGLPFDASRMRFWEVMFPVDI